MTGSRRLLTWLGAGAIIVTSAPAAYATAVVRTTAVQTTGVQPRDSAPCGFSPQDFRGPAGAADGEPRPRIADGATCGALD
jgi:hypothetical protein